ncbi:hypothetical protein PV325_007133, partial [Microctonus aethiopoides]
MNISDYQYSSESFTMQIILAFLLIIVSTATFSVNANPRLYNAALHDDLEDFLALVPKAKVLSISHEYSKHDKEVQYILEYIQSSEFQKLVETITSIPDVINLNRYFRESGFNVYYLMNKLRDIIGLPSLSSLKEPVIKITGGVFGFIADIKYVLPINDIKALYHEKIETSVEFKKLIEHFKLPKFQAVVNTLLADAEFKEIIKKAKAVGVDTKAITDLLSTIFGLEFPVHEIIILPPALHDDLEEFLALIPIDEVSSIFLEYVTHDKEVQYVVEYVQTSEFRELVKAIESIPDVVTFYEYLQESGLDIYDLVNKLHEFIGLPPLVPRIASLQITGGVIGLIADIKTALPIDDIKALYYEKLETSIEFKKLIERLQSPVFQAVVDTLLANSEFQEIVEKAKAIGLDIKAITDLLSTIFGLEFPEQEIIRMTPGLHDDLEDFLALIPVDEVSSIFLEYVTHDKEVQYVVEYVQTSEFRELVKAIESIQDVVTFYEYLQESGLDIYYLVNKLHEFIGLPPLVPRVAPIQITGGVTGLIADIKNVLPIDDIKALYHEKLETSVEFKKLIERLQLPAFQAVIDTLLANSEFQEIVEKAKAIGVDIKAITDLLSTIFGLEFPRNQQIVSHTQSLDFSGGMSLFAPEIVKEVSEQYLDNDDEIKKLIQYFRREGFKNIINTIDHSSTVHHLSQHSYEFNFDIYQLVNVLRSILDISDSKPEIISNKMTSDSQVTFRSLKDDVHDFISLISIDKVAKITIKYILNDAEVHTAIEYIESQKLENLVVKLQKDPEVYELLKYFVDSGADIISIIKIFNEFLDFPPYQFPKKINRDNAVTNGVQGMLNEIRAILPYDQIKIMYNKKLRESQEFRYFIERIEDPAFQKIVDKIVVNDNVLELGYQAELHGINIDAIVKFLSEVFGLNLPDPPYFPSNSNHFKRRRSLSDDFTDFYDLLPIEHIVELAVQYVLKDEEMQEVIAYIHSQPFKNIISALHEIPEYEQILIELRAKGVDVNSIISKLQEIIGFGDTHSSSFQEGVIKPGLTGFIESVKELLPHDRIKALYEEKLKTSEPFAEFVALIRSEKFQILTNKLFTNEDFKSLLNKAEGCGVDLQEISDFFLQVFGIETPPGHAVRMEDIQIEDNCIDQE